MYNQGRGRAMGRRSRYEREIEEILRRLEPPPPRRPLRQRLFSALATLRQALRTFPPRLRERLVSWNVALAWHYLEHLETALQRADWPFFTDRLARLLAAYFDALFALNERFHPGEKRLLAYAAGCERAPADHQRRLARLVDPSTGAAERVDLARDLLRDLAGLSP
uniref:DUF4037 domain-containing protein n=1 Tax=Thermorudis sp. TaxID=1969470 RepID=A0A7C2WD88_9BACT